MQVKTLIKEEWPLFEKEIFEIFLTNSPYEKREKKDQEYYFQFWVKEYFSRHPDLFWIALDSENSVIGYICICPDSQIAKSWIPWESYSVFEDYFKTYPSHLHINLSKEYHGKGYGSKFLSQVLFEYAKPVHIITETGQENVNFYLKNSFQKQAERPFKGHSLLLMSCDQSQ